MVQRGYFTAEAAASRKTRWFREGEAPAEPGISNDIRLGGSLALLALPFSPPAII